MATAEDPRHGLAMACFRTLLDLGVEMGISLRGTVAIGCLEEQWPAVREVLDGVPTTFLSIVQEHCCEPWTGVDAPYVADAVRFNHRKKPSLMSWRTDRGRIKQSVHRKRRGRWKWVRIR